MTTPSQSAAAVIPAVLRASQSSARSVPVPGVADAPVALPSGQPAVMSSVAA